MQRHLALALVVAALSACQDEGFLPSAPTHAQVTTGAFYTAVDLGTFGGVRSRAQAINDQGQVVGFSVDSAGHFHGWLWENGTAIDLGSLGGAYTVASDINNHGQVVGVSDSGPYNRAFLWQNGTMSNLGTLGGWASGAYSINDSGQVSGWSLLAGAQGTNERRAFRWQDGVMLQLDVGQGVMQEGWGINASGAVVGGGVLTGGSGIPHALLWNVLMIDLGSLGGAQSRALRINARSQAVGWGFNNPYDYTHALLWENGTTIDLLPSPGGVAMAINDNSQVVGGGGDAFVASGNAFLWENGATTDLGTLGGSWSRAYDINDVGQIVGESEVANGEIHATLWTVAPTP